MPTPPFVPPPGQAVAWAYPSAVGAYKGIPLVSMSVGDPAFDFSLGLQDAHAIRLLSGFLIEEHYRVRWTGFSAPSLPLNAGAVHGIYPVAVASLSGTPVGFMTLEFDNGVTSATLFSTSVDTFDSTYFSGSSIGTSLGDVSSMLADLSDASTTSGSGRYDAHVTFLALAIYYDAPILPIGHGANCNAYDPITIADGATTPPGNGLLIS